MAKPIVVGMIPARYGSSRLPGKALKPIAGKSMVQRVCGCPSKTMPGPSPASPRETRSGGAPQPGKAKRSKTEAMVFMLWVLDE